MCEPSERISVLEVDVAIGKMKYALAERGRNGRFKNKW